MTSLRELQVPRSIGDEGLAHLKGLTELQHLNLRGASGVTDAGLVHLEGMTKLDSLILDFTTITDAGLEHLATLPSLRFLSLRNTRATGSGLVHLKGSRKLASLGLGREVTDAGMASLALKRPSFFPTPAFVVKTVIVSGKIVVSRCYLGQ